MLGRQRWPSYESINKTLLKGSEMYCSKCGVQNSDGATQCVNCGSVLMDTPPAGGGTAGPGCGCRAQNQWLGDCSFRDGAVEYDLYFMAVFGIACYRLWYYCFSQDW